MGKINKINQALILCGGLGTRFRAVSEKIPKSLAIVSGKPMLNWLIDDLLKIGIKDIILATGYLSEQIENHVKEKYNDVCLISKEKKSLGTGGAIKNAQRFIKSDNFIILNGDTRVNYDISNLIKFHFNKCSDFSLLLSSQTTGQNYGQIILSETSQLKNFGTETASYKENNFSNAGVYCMKYDFLNDLKLNQTYSLENELIPEWITFKKVFGLVIDKPFTDIGTLDRYNKASFS